MDLPKVEVREEMRTLRDFYPRPEVRRAVHYSFAHQFLVQTLRQNSRAFFWSLMLHGLPGGVTEPTRFIQSQWAAFEHQLGQVPWPHDFLEKGLLFRRVSDLSMTLGETAGRPLALVRMPPPEQQTQAHFVAVVLEASPRRPESWPKDVTARLFTLEEPDTELSRGGRMGVVCEWTMEPRHRFLGRVVPTEEKAFMDCVTGLLRAPETPEVAGHTPEREGKPMVITVGHETPAPTAKPPKPWWRRG